MSAEYTNNHYVPQWYQKRFIPPSQLSDQKLYLLDFKPASFKGSDGVKRHHRAVRRVGTRKCFAVDDLYTTTFEGVESRELERVFFGEVDALGKKAVEFFATYDHDRLEDHVLEHMMLYMSTQKLRTPKGLDWLVGVAGAHDRSDVLDELTHLRSIYGAIWSECAWQIADASQSPTKFIISDHPVTVYNRACAPGHPMCKGVNDPDIRLQATHTLFPLSHDRLLILTNMLWACNPHRRPLEPRPNPDLFRGAMFNFTEVQVRRMLTEAEVLKINCITKKRARRFIAAGREEWLYPERNVRFNWRAIGDEYLLMPDPRSLHPGAEIMMGFTGGRTSSMDTFGRTPGDAQFGLESRSAIEISAHSRWRKEFGDFFGPQRRGLAMDEVARLKRGT